MSVETVEPIETIVRPKRQPKTRVHRKMLPLYHVILLDDDDHTFGYVIRMLGELFGHSPEKAFLMAHEVHTTGRVIVDTTPLERAELKRDQIHAYGADPDSKHSKGSMSAYIEPAEDA